MRFAPPCLAALAAAVLLSSHALAKVDEWKFRVYLDEKNIGYHQFRLREDGGQKQLVSEARFKVKFLFINAYQYRHDSSELWAEDCLKHIDAKTYDNGKTLAVRGNTEGTRFVVQGTGGGASLPACPMTFAYWNPRILSQTHLLNAQTGEYQEVRIESLGQEKISVRGTETAAQRYALVAQSYRIDLWYAQDGRWLALQTITEKGRLLRYAIQ
jgi:Family of unknown function (DUF6134)